MCFIRSRVKGGTKNRTNMSQDFVKSFKDGKKACIFEPAIDAPDGGQASQYAYESVKYGISYDTAAANAAKRNEGLRAMCHYEVHIPCVACANCTIIQEWDNGQYVNNAYFCNILKGPCERYGTCDRGQTGKLGPQVIRRNMTMAEILAHKDELVN